jgi:hypothetical protein
MSSINPKTSFPSAQLVAHGNSVLTNTAASVVVEIPTTTGGQRPSYARVACYSLTGGANAPPAAVHIFAAPAATNATATTGDTILYSTESLWLNTLGMHALGAIGVVGNVRVQVTPLEEGAIGPSVQGLSGTG